MEAINIKSPGAGVTVVGAGTELGSSGTAAMLLATEPAPAHIFFSFFFLISFCVTGDKIPGPHTFVLSKHSTTTELCSQTPTLVV